MSMTRFVRPIYTIILVILTWGGGVFLAMAGPSADGDQGEMTPQKAIALAEKFGVDVGEVDEEIKNILGLTKAEGVVVFAVIGGSPAELAGIKVKAVIKEVDKHEIKTLTDLGHALDKALQTENFSVATYEPADPDNQGLTGGLNFHFVRLVKD